MRRPIHSKFKMLYPKISQSRILIEMPSEFSKSNNKYFNSRIAWPPEKQFKDIKAKIRLNKLVKLVWQLYLNRHGSKNRPCHQSDCFTT